MSHTKHFLRFLLLSLLVADALTVSAQGISVASFRRLDNDLTANIAGTMMKDQNGDVAALIGKAQQLQPLVVHGKAFLNIFMKPLRCPATETNCHIRLNTIANCDNYIEVVMVYFAFYFTASFFLNYKEFLYSCFPR